MYTSTDAKPWTVPMLADAKRDGRKLVMLTAYDAGFARVLEENGTDLVLVGDSLGMVVQGHGSTLPVTVDDIAYHVQCVARGLRTALDSPRMLLTDTWPLGPLARMRQVMTSASVPETLRP